VALSCSTASQPCAAYRGRARIERLVGKLKRFKRVARTAGLTAWRALVVEGGLKAGDVVLVLGTGDVSIFALQLAKMMGATVIATSSSDEKLERVRAMGADLTINCRQHEDWALARAIGLAGAVSTMSLRGTKSREPISAKSA
jgi:D-arabinose 1-dehydrogenase-like Zn-dependent alcohol dehydrogenase